MCFESDPGLSVINKRIKMYPLGAVREWFDPERDLLSFADYPHVVYSGEILRHEQGHQEDGTPGGHPGDESMETFKKDSPGCGKTNSGGQNMGNGPNNNFDDSNMMGGSSGFYNYRNANVQNKIIGEHSEHMGTST